MDTRKVQKLGESTLAMTLPVEWRREHNVKKGDSLTTQFNGRGSLTVIPETINRSETEAVIHAEKDLKKQALERIIIAQYVLGRKSIVIKSSGKLTNAQATAVYEAERQLMGLSIIEETPEKISVRSSVDTEDFRIDNMIERLKNTGLTMRNEAVKSLIHGNMELAERALNREKQANKIFVLLLRLIFTTYQNPQQVQAVGVQDGFTLIGYHSIAKNLELAADDAEDIATTVVESEGKKLDVNKKTVRNINDFNTQVGELNTLAIDAATEQNYDLYQKCISKFQDIKVSKENMLEEIPEIQNTELLRIRQVVASLYHTSEYAVRNAEIAANFALSQDSEYITIN